VPVQIAERAAPCSLMPPPAAGTPVLQTRVIASRQQPGAEWADPERALLLQPLFTPRLAAAGANL